MKVLIIGNEKQAGELMEKLGDGHTYFGAPDIMMDRPEGVEGAEVVFDFNLDEQPDNWEFYNEINPKAIFINIPKTSLAEQMYVNGQSDSTVIGFNGLPSFVNREVLEVSLYSETDKTILEELCSALGTEYELVDDRVGMVTPRIIFMIINEAYYTVQEGTASKQDIDLGMKLGTNYPYGPFEWCDMIGVNHVYELLEAVYDDTRDERYKICPLLKKEYLKQINK